MGDKTFILPIQLGENNYFSMTKTEKEKIKENLKFIFSTDIGERIINSKIGSNFRKILFENQSSKIDKDIENEVNRIFREYFPNLILEQLNFNILPNNALQTNVLSIVLEYSINNVEDSKDKLSLAIA
jgi:phage baseplate assembly protein W